jgi:hypothetical protein
MEIAKATSTPPLKPANNFFSERLVIDSPHWTKQVLEPIETSQAEPQKLCRELQKFLV